MATQQRPRAASLKAKVGQKVARVRARSRVSINLPDRFRQEDEDDDVDDGTGVGNNDNALFAQQSIYGMLAATQSGPSFPPNFQQDSGSESEEDDGNEETKDSGARGPQAQHKDATSSRQDASKHPRTFPEAHLARSWLEPVQERSSSSARDHMTQSQLLPPKRSGGSTPSARPGRPVLDRKLQAMARARISSPIPPASTEQTQQNESDTIRASNKARLDKSLPEVIASIFHFAEPEEVISEYPCWYLQNVLLQGYMYITEKHICFYAYLQKKTNVVVKSGYLGKQGRHSYRYRRFWFVLKGDIFSYYRDASDPYSPQGLVDLRDAISADLTVDQGDEGVEFTITTASRVYLYRADTLASAKEWVKQLQRIIFRSHNDSDSVKISLPVANVVDVERSPVIDFAETIRLRVIDNDETYAMDEYFFTFFSFGRDAWTVLNTLTGANDAKIIAGLDAPDRSTLASPSAPSQTPKRGLSPGLPRPPSSPIAEPVRTTLSPLPPSPKPGSKSPRDGSDVPPIAAERPSARFDRRGRSVSAASASSFQDCQVSSPATSSPTEESSESFVTTSEHPSIATMDGDEIDAHMSASQMLSGDGVFGAPTLRLPRESGQADMDGTTSGALPSISLSPRPGNIRIQPPSPETSQQTLSVARPQVQRQQSDASNRTVVPPGPPLNTYEATLPSRATRGLTAPLQHAINVAGIVRIQSKRMSSYLSSSPKTYIDKWSGALAGGKRHYADIPGLAPEDSVRDPEQEFDVADDERRFREHFGLPASEKLVSVFYCWLHRTVPFYGKVYISNHRFCFRSLLYGTRTKLVIPYTDILTVQKQRGFRWGNPGMVLVIRGHEELFFDFQSPGLRDDCVVTVLRSLELIQVAAATAILSEEELKDAQAAAAENRLLEAARKDGYTEHELELPRNIDTVEVDAPPILFDDTHASMLDFKPPRPMSITCLTIGSRGDVQPYIALCKGLLADGHKVKIATHGEFRAWVESHGIEFAEVSGDPAELMRICVENGMFTPAFFLEANTKFRSWLESLLTTAYEACRGSDLLIESPSAMCGIHIAEALQIPYFRAFTMPWTRTRAYPHAFAVPNRKLGGSYNYMTYTLFDNMFWQATAGQINKWRTKSLGLAPTSLDKLQQNKVPFLYNFSPSVVVPPLDFSDWIKVTGYWFLDEGETYTPPRELAGFIKKARADKAKLVYIGFGSVTVSDSRQLTQQIVEAVVKADVRCILSKGWSDRFDKQNASEPEIELPSCIHQIRAAPHDWLFRQVDAVVHHGGAGTTGASLRAGKPTLIKPFFGDQYFFATRVEDLGVGMHLKKVTALQLSKALWIATHDDRMGTKAHVLGEAIRSENGVQTAIKAIYRDFEYAKSLIKKRVTYAQRPGATDADYDVDGGADDTEENWTFVENEGDSTLNSADDEIQGKEKEKERDADLGPVQTKTSLREHARHLSISSVVRRARKD